MSSGPPDAITTETVPITKELSTIIKGITEKQSWIKIFNKHCERTGVARVEPHCGYPFTRASATWQEHRYQSNEHDFVSAAFEDLYQQLTVAVMTTEYRKVEVSKKTTEI